MKPKEINHRLNRLQERVQAGEADEACILSREIFVELLKSVYSQVRGQASPVVMRELLDLEIEIGGENGDFRHFDHQKMIDLFVKGDLAGRAEALSLLKSGFSRVVDLKGLSNRLESEATPSLAGLRFTHAWLRLFAEEAEIIDPDMSCCVSTQPPVKDEVQKIVELGKPYTDPITGMTFVWVTEGTYSMGDTFDEGADDEKPVHEVTLSPFAVAATPVTQTQWLRLMDENPSNFTGDDHPEGDTLLFTVNKVGVVSNQLHQMNEGDVMGVRGPLGNSYPLKGDGGQKRGHRGRRLRGHHPALHGHLDAAPGPPEQLRRHHLYLRRAHPGPAALRGSVARVAKSATTSTATSPLTARWRAGTAWWASCPRCARRLPPSRTTRWP